MIKAKGHTKIRFLLSWELQNKLGNLNSTFLIHFCYSQSSLETPWRIILWSGSNPDYPFLINWFCSIIAYLNSIVFQGQVELIRRNDFQVCCMDWSFFEICRNRHCGMKFLWGWFRTRTNASHFRSWTGALWCHIGRNIVVFIIGC